MNTATFRDRPSRQHQCRHKIGTRPTRATIAWSVVGNLGKLKYTRPGASWRSCEAQDYRRQVTSRLESRRRDSGERAGNDVGKLPLDACAVVLVAIHASSPAFDAG